MMDRKRRLSRRLRRAAAVPAALTCLVFLSAAQCGPIEVEGPAAGASGNPTSVASARAELGELAVKGRAPLTGYGREEYGHSWLDTDRNGCDTRNDILRRDLDDLDIESGTNGCVVLSGVLVDPYTGDTVTFRRGGRSEVDIDHRVSLSNAWQTGAFLWDEETRKRFANDPLNLVAVTASSNRSKSDSDAASWLPPRRRYWCEFIAAQIEVKRSYRLWVTRAERGTMRRVLGSCR